MDSAPWHAVGVHLGVLLRVPPPSPISQTGWAARAELMRNKIGIKFSERDVGRPSTDFVHFEAVGAALKSTFLRSDGTPRADLPQTGRRWAGRQAGGAAGGQAGRQQSGCKGLEHVHESR